jgi:hypothetical protein
LLVFSGVTAAVAAVAAWIALLRHFAQTDADRQRRITESYSKAVEQLASDKIEVRLGGIYTLERISRESSGDYWNAMEILCAFTRNRARWKAPEADLLATVDRHNQSLVATENRNGSPTDVAAVLAVIVRRDASNRQRESDNGWRFDFGGTDLCGANLEGSQLEGGSFVGAHLERALLNNARLSRAKFVGAHLEKASLVGANLEEVSFRETGILRTPISLGRIWTERF